MGKDRVITTYEEYLSAPGSLTFEEMQMLHKEMISEIGKDADGLELYDELVRTATRYAKIRSEWLLMDSREKKDTDSSRTACHDSVITKFNMLSRYLRSAGKESAWRDVLGYEEDDRMNRKRAGDFACYIVFVNSINAR